MNISDNGLIAQLSPGDQSLLLRLCKPHKLAAGEILSDSGTTGRHVYFLAGASVVLFVRNGDSSGLGLGLTGHEGAVGLQFALGLGAGNFVLWVQTPGDAWRVESIELQRLINRRPGMLLVFSRYIWFVSQDVAALAACSQIQDIKARLASWLVLSDRRTNGHDTLDLTHAHLAQMLGVRRSSITLAAVELKQSGLLDYQRGRIQILDRPGLEAASCWVPGLHQPLAN